VKPMSPVMIDYATIAVRIALGAVFIFSSVGKIAQPSAFAEIVTNYRLLPPSLVWATAVFFPWIEAVCATALIFGRLEKGAALMISIMMVVFIAILVYNGYRGLDIACGCFSLSAQAPSNIILNSLRNVVILSAGIWVLISSSYRRPKPAPAETGY
jgi:uncharacterized membrane protein YphA (DoxX/SURF4 family)